MPSYDEAGSETDGAPNEHGTCMLHKAIGPEIGISKAARAVIVRIPEAKPRNAEEKLAKGSRRFTATVAAMEKVLEDIKLKGKEKQSVVMIAWGFPASPSLPVSGQGFYLLYDVMKRLMENFAILVVASSNTEDNDEPNPVSSCFTKYSTHLLSLSRVKLCVQFRQYGGDLISL